MTSVGAWITVPLVMFDDDRHNHLCPTRLQVLPDRGEVHRTSQLVGPFSFATETSYKLGVGRTRSTVHTRKSCAPLSFPSLQPRHSASVSSAGTRERCVLTMKPQHYTKSLPTRGSQQAVKPKAVRSIWEGNACHTAQRKHECWR